MNDFKDSMDSNTIECSGWHRLALELQHGPVRTLSGLLQRGCLIRTRIGTSVGSLLRNQFGLSPEYIESHVQTIFLNGRAVDDMESSLLGEGNTLALSSAMPGLVGATFRRGGYFAPMRAAVTHMEEEEQGGKEVGTITLKLFNLLIEDIGRLVLERGVFTKGQDLCNAFKGEDEEFWKRCRSARFDERSIDPASLPFMSFSTPDECVELKVRFLDNGAHS